jgi:hypothetical protein
MKARQLIANSSFGPEQVKAMGKALDDAWALLAPSVDDRPEAIQAARFALADIILSLGAQGNFDAKSLADTAVQLMVSRSSRFSPEPEASPATAPRK